MSEELPDGWASARLEDLKSTEPNAFTDGPFGSKLKTEHYVSEGVRVVRLGNIGVGIFIPKDRAYITAEHFDGLRKHEIFPRDLLIAALAEPVGRCCEVPPDLGTAIVKADCIRFKPTEEVDRRIIMYWLNSPRGKLSVEELSHGLGRLRINMQDMRSVPVPLPPKPEQHRIVKKVEALFARSARARDELARIPRLIERYRQAVLEAAFRGDLTAEWRTSHPNERPVQTDQLRQVKRRGSRTAVAQLRAGATDMGELPLTWVAAQIGSVARLQPGYAFKSQDFSAKGVRLLRGTNIVPDGTRWEEVVHLPTHMAPEFEEYRLQAGDVVIAMDRPLISGGLKVACLGEADLPALLLQRVGRFDHQPCLDPAYLWHFLHSNLFIDHIRDQATGSDLPHISATDIETVAIPLPPLEEQRAIAACLTALFSGAERASRECERANSLLERLNSSILDKAFAGELVPQDPADEPATALLARIKEARAEAPATRRERRKQGHPHHAGR